MKRTLFMAAGVMVWAVHFTAIYGYTGLACARGWERSVTPAVTVMTMIAAVGAGAVVFAGLKRRGHFEPALAAGLAGFALLAILWEGAGVAFLVPCAAR